MTIEMTRTDLPTGVQSITFGADMPTSFGKTVEGLTRMREGGPHLVGLVLFAEDWTSMLPPADYRLVDVRWRDELSPGLPAMENDEAWAVVQRCNDDGDVAPGATIELIPCSRIPRLHVY